MITARAGLEKAEAEIAVRLAKVQADLNKLRVKAQTKLDRAMAEAEKAKAEVRARENHREASRRHSEQMTDWVKDKKKEVEVLRGWKAVDDVGVSSFPVIKLANANALTERTRGQVKRVAGFSCPRCKLGPICFRGSSHFYIHRFI